MTMPLNTLQLLVALIGDIFLGLTTSCQHITRSFCIVEKTIEQCLISSFPSRVFALDNTVCSVLNSLFTIIDKAGHFLKNDGSFFRIKKSSYVLPKDVFPELLQLKTFTSNNTILILNLLERKNPPLPTSSCNSYTTPLL